MTMENRAPAPSAEDVMLSVCIPTYQRKARVLALVAQMLNIDSRVEVCVHVDGATDGTGEALHALAAAHPRLKVTEGPNRGRAPALVQAIGSATAPFTMLFDDDDDVIVEGVQTLLNRLENLPDDCCGFICHMHTENGHRLGSEFPAERSNFLKLRLQQSLRGDKKEIVLTRLLKQVAQSPAVGVRRVPTSLLWSRIALEYDVVCLNLDVGVKRYLAEGYTHNIARIKRANPGPMRHVHALNVLGFLKGRHRSVPSALRGAVAFCGYTVLEALKARAATP